MKQFFALMLCVCFAASAPMAHAQWGNKKKQEEQEQQEELDYEAEAEAIEREGHDIVVHLDELDENWHEIAETLGTYDGFARYCEEEPYREEVNGLLDNVHHYDTLLYQILMRKAELEGVDHKLKITLAEIEKVETKYKPRNFVHKLNDDCKGRRELERNKKELERDVQMHSYDGQALLIDNDIHTYIQKVTHILDLVDKHAHHLLD